MAATASSQGKPICAPIRPAMTTSDDSASERWCQALAMTRLELTRLPTARVYQKSGSLETTEITATHSAMRPGTGSGSELKRWDAALTKIGRASCRERV